MTEEFQQVLVNGKWPIFLPPHRAARAEWNTEEGWERVRLDSMYQHLVLEHNYPDLQEIVFYVGAEEGEMPALCSMWGAKVFLFEPNPRVWANIRGIWEKNQLEKPVGCFVGFASNKTELNPPMLDFDNSMRDGWPISAYGEIISDHGFRELYQQADATPQIKIDDCGVVPTSISIDVEGSEWRVLEGAEQTLKNHRPKIWLSGHPEMMQHQFREYLSDLRGWIGEFGYKETLLEYKHEVHLLYLPL